MSKPVIGVSPEDTLELAARKMSEHRIGCLVVTDGTGRMLGIISERDIISRVTAQGLDPSSTIVRDCMTADVVCCPPGTPMHHIEAVMDGRGIRHVPVVEDGMPISMVSAREVLRHRHATDRSIRSLTVFALAELAESRDPETGEHLERVRAYAAELAKELASTQSHGGEVDTDFVRLIYETSPLHDIGKVSIPDCVLLKPGRLDEMEFQIMKTHARRGAETLDMVLARFPNEQFLQMGRSIAAFHHERYDGKGYPDGLAGDRIPLCARIFALADVYDALVCRRVYKDAYSHGVARTIVAESAGTQFDPAIVEAFLSSSDRFDDIRRRHDLVTVAA